MISQLQFRMTRLRVVAVWSLAVLGAATCVAVAYTWMKPALKRADPIVVTTLQCAAGMLPLVVLGLALEGCRFRSSGARQRGPL